MFSKFKVEKPSHVLYKSGARHFEAEKSANILSLPIVEAYDQQIRLMSAEIERLKVRKSIDQGIIQSKVTPLAFAKGWFPYDRRRSRIADRRKFCDRLRSYGNTLHVCDHMETHFTIIWKHTSRLRSYGNTLLVLSSAIICDRWRSCDHMETKVLRSKCIP